MISIRKYLLLDGLKGAGETAPRADMFEFLRAVLGRVGELVLGPEADARFAGQLAVLKKSIHQDWTAADAAQAGERLSRLLEEHRAALRMNALRQGNVLQHMFAMLNQALIVLSQGRNQSVLRLHMIQESLEKTSVLQDLTTLKAWLAETVKFVQEELKSDQEAAEKEVVGVQTEVGRVREMLGRARPELFGRAKAVARITNFFRAAGAEACLHLLAFGFDRLQATTQRYGPQVTEELFTRLIRERVEPLADNASLYRWSGASLVALFEWPGTLADLRAEVARLNRGPMVHRVAMGNRTAVLTLTPSCLVAEGQAAELEGLIEQVDRFTAVHG